MNCKSAKAKLALWVGHDLEGVELCELRRHLDACPECAEHWARLKSTMGVLEFVQSDTDEAAELPHKSLWPAVAVRIAHSDALTRGPRFNGWIPAAAVAAACLALIVFSNTALIHTDSADELHGGISSDPVRFDLDPDAFERYEKLIGVKLDKIYPDESWKAGDGILPQNPGQTKNSNLRPVNNAGAGGF